MNFYKDLIILGYWFFYFFNSKYVGSPIFCVYNCFHEEQKIFFT